MGIVVSYNKNQQMKKDITLRQNNLSRPEFQELQKDENENQYKNQEHECTIWNSHKQIWFQRKFQICFTPENQIKYIFDGQIFKIEQLQDGLERPEVQTNLEQIKYLLWRGNYSKNHKIGKWTAYWKGKKMKEVGGYYNQHLLKVLYSENGFKQGYWKEIMKNYCKKFKVCELGEYYNNQKIRQWNYVYKNKKIGGGFYNEQALKNGKWIELSEGFQQREFITFICEYKNGKNVGIQDIWCENFNNIFPKRILYDNLCVFYSGGGLYDEKGDGVKQGNWMEIFDGLNYTSKVMYQGHYKNGKKVRRWDILNDNIKIGGGQYDEEGNGIKLGEWKEISFGYNIGFQVTSLGEYENDQKIGIWDFQFSGFNYDPLLEKNCGQYYKGAKLGMWIDLDEGFEKSLQAIHKGEYKKGQKVGRWDIQIKRQNDDSYQKIFDSGGGLYANGVKFGKWIDLDDEFKKDKLVTHTGEYINGRKVGRWDIDFKIYNFSSFSTIGGGSYDEGVKFGKWIDLDEGFEKAKQVTYTGEYKNGQKIDRWNINFKSQSYDQFSKIGGGSYTDGVKFGKWIDLDEDFSQEKQVIHTGEYINGVKVSRWIEMERNEKNVVEGFKKVNESLYEY